MLNKLETEITEEQFDECVFSSLRKFREEGYAKRARRLSAVYHRKEELKQDSNVEIIYYTNIDKVGFKLKHETKY